jgi:3-oxoacyl-[acyl-carrier protein] reductase
MDKYVVVTGASKGLGLAICKEALAAGYAVVGLVRTFSVQLQD